MKTYENTWKNAKSNPLLTGPINTLSVHFRSRFFHQIWSIFLSVPCKKKLSKTSKSLNFMDFFVHQVPRGITCVKFTQNFAKTYLLKQPYFLQILIFWLGIFLKSFPIIIGVFVPKEKNYQGLLHIFYEKCTRKKKFKNFSKKSSRNLKNA